ncbi:MAG TPA: M48 family metallopeptidase [Verrucomicrobiae bacterium]|nr:M48 family metallopeptidase [Verrucomicrobiae bacterium]
MQPSVYATTAFHPSLPGTGLTGQLQTAPYSLRFESDSMNVEVPYEGLDIDFGGWDQNRVVFQHADLPEWTFFCHDRRILNERAFGQRPRLREQIREFRRRQDGKKRVRQSLVFLVCFVLAAGLIYAFSGSITNRVVNSVPVSVEKAIGDQTFEEIKAKGKLVDDPPVVARLNDLTSRLVKAQPKSRYDFQVYLLKSSAPNAYAVPGGKLFVTTKMLEFTSDPEELAGVMAHEIAHVTERHGLRTMVASAGPLALLQAMFGSDAGVVGIVTRGSAVLLSQRFSRDHEREADEKGWRNLVAANIDPRGMKRFMEKLAKLERDEDAGDLSILGTHPPTQERIQRMAELWRQEPRKSGFVDFRSQPMWSAPVENSPPSTSPVRQRSFIRQ